MRCLSNPTFMNPIQLAHKDFLTALLNLYTTLDALAIINPATPLRLPPSPYGLHPPSTFNATAAHAAGYSPGAVALLSSMPHLDVGQHEIFFALRPSTYPVSYLGADLDEGYFSAQREMLDGELMPPSAIRLTWEEGGHGIVWLYDTETKLMHEWDTYSSPSPSTNEYSHVPGLPPSAVLAPLTAQYRQLHYLGHATTSYEVEHSHGSASYFATFGRGGPQNEGWSALARARHAADFDVWAAVRGLEGLYLGCGWDVEAGGGEAQVGFRRGEFVERRERYWREVVEPLERERERVG